MKKMITLLVILSMMIISAGCSNPSLPGDSDGGSTESGKLSLTLSKSDLNRSILPDIDMQIASYDISGQGPSGAAFSETGVTGTTFSCFLDAGDWTISVKAKNVNGIVIYEGQTSVTLELGKTAAADITVRPLQGHGSLSLTVDWKTNTLYNPSVVSTLTPSVGAAKNLSFTVNGNKAVSSTSAIETGYHTLILKLLENGNEAIGKATIVRIVKDQTTDGTIVFNKVNKTVGRLDINLTRELGEPLDVSISGQAPTLEFGKQMVLTAGVSSYTGNVTYVWYVNGDAKKNGSNVDSSYTLSNLAKGFYNIDVTAYSAEGTRAGHSSFELEVIDALPSVTHKSIAAYGAFSFALKSDGTVWSWGNNGYGQLGDGSSTNKHTPVQIPGLTSIKAIGSGDANGYALTNEGVLWGWGFNRNGRLGDGTSVDRNTPVQVLNLTNVESFFPGMENIFAIQKNGTVWAWGSNSAGQLGDGSGVNSNVPVQITGLTTIKMAAPGQFHTAFLKEDGTVWTTGSGGYGQLGDGTTKVRYAPLEIAGFTNVKQIASGKFHSIAVKEDGTVWAWGDNRYGQIGDGTTVNKLTPVQVTGLTDVAMVSAGVNGNFALKNDGTLWAWGRNHTGQLGDGTKIDRTSPVQITAVTDIQAIESGNSHTLILKKDGTIQAVGYNSNGQLGNNTTTGSLIPVNVIFP